MRFNLMNAKMSQWVTNSKGPVSGRNLLKSARKLPDILNPEYTKIVWAFPC